MIRKLLGSLLLIFTCCGPTELAPDQSGSSCSFGDFVIACDTCTAEEIENKKIGLSSAMSALETYVGSVMAVDVCPITFHLDGDKTCGTAAVAESYGVAGFAWVDVWNKGQICLFDKERGSLDASVASSIGRQMLAVHEIMHIWFNGRYDGYPVEESFVTMVSYELCGFDSIDNCRPYEFWKDGPDALMSYLCELGLRPADVPHVLRAIDSAGRDLTTRELSDVIGSELGFDVDSAFIDAGIEL